MFNTFEDYISNTTQAQRQLHIDLNSECSFKGRNGKDYASKRRSQDAARNNIVNYLIEQGILDISLKDAKFGKTGKVQVNHMCACHSGDDGPVCNNSLHLYLGTAKENWHDVDPKTNQTALEKASAAFKTEEVKEKRSIGQKLAWEERKLRFLQSDKE
jgi:hypothetical protein